MLTCEMHAQAVVQMCPVSSINKSIINGEVSENRAPKVKIRASVFQAKLILYPLTKQLKTQRSVI